MVGWDSGLVRAGWPELLATRGAAASGLGGRCGQPAAGPAADAPTRQAFLAHAAQLAVAALPTNE